MKSQGVSLKVLVLLFAALIASSCDEPQSEGRGSIGDNRAGSKFLLKVPRSDDKVFLVNMNTFGPALGYDTGSLQVYSVADEENLNRPEFSVEIPNFAKSAVVNEKYIFLTYDALEDDPARVFVFPYNLDGDGSLTLEPAQIFNLESSNKADAKLKARYSAVNEGYFVVSCQEGEVFVMDLNADELGNPVHVRSYGDKVTRSAIGITDDNFLLLFPNRPVAGQIKVSYDKEDKYTEAGAPVDLNKDWDVAKMGISPYKLAILDLTEELVYKPLDEEVQKNETFWLSFDLKGTKSSDEKRYFRTYFTQIKINPDDGSFYLLQKGLEKNEEDKSEKNVHRVLKLKKNLKSEEEERSAQGVFDSFEFLEEPLFSAVEDKFKFNFQSFEILDEEKKEILIMSYHFSKSRDKSDFALLKTSSKDSFEFINKTKKNNDAYRNLLLFGEGESQKYLTIKDYFRFSSKLVLKPIAQKE